MTYKAMEADGGRWIVVNDDVNAAPGCCPHKHSTQRPAERCAAEMNAGRRYDSAGNKTTGKTKDAVDLSVTRALKAEKMVATGMVEAAEEVAAELDESRAIGVFVCPAETPFAPGQWKKHECSKKGERVEMPFNSTQASPICSGCGYKLRLITVKKPMSMAAKVRLRALAMRRKEVV